MFSNKYPTNQSSKFTLVYFRLGVIMLSKCFQFFKEMQKVFANVHHKTDDFILFVTLLKSMCEHIKNNYVLKNITIILKN